jgi:hypothetical protein
MTETSQTWARRCAPLPALRTVYGVATKTSPPVVFDCGSVCGSELLPGRLDPCLSPFYDRLAIILVC